MNPKKYFKIFFFIMFFSALFAATLTAADNCENPPCVDMPDYTILSVTPDRDAQVQGGEIVLTAVVKNVGDGATLRSSSLIWEVCTKFCGREENWSISETDTISGLKVGQEEIETYTHEMDFGSTTFRVKCDYVDGNSGGAIVEKNETNNMYETPEIITEYPDLTIATYDENGTQPMIWWSPKYPLEGQEVTFYAGITNMGKGGTIDDFEVDFIIYLNQKVFEKETLGSDKYKDGIPLGPMPQNYTFCNISSKDTWSAVPGNHWIKAQVNPKGTISEDLNLQENLSQSLDISIQYPDLTIGTNHSNNDINIWWVPEVPKDGEEVTFYATIENLGFGGSILEFDVDFTLYELDNVGGKSLKPVSLGSATVKDQILPAHKKPIHTDRSGCFEAQYLSTTDWKVISGSVSLESHCAEADSMCVSKLSNLKYVRLSGANSIIRSKNAFQIDDDTLIFRAIASGSGKRWLSLCEPGTNCSGSNQLLSQEIATSKDNWKVYVMDLSQLRGKQVTCEINSGTSSNSVLKVDDIRMSIDITDESAVMVSIPFSDVWEAYPFSKDLDLTPGQFEIVAKLSENNTIKEDDVTNQEKLVPLHDDQQPDKSWIFPADYDFVSINVTPPAQFIGKNFLYEVVIKNYGGPTIIDSSLNWYLSEKENQFGSSLETDDIPGLDRNGIDEHTFELPVTNGNISVFAFLNDDFLLKETNNWSLDDPRYNRASDIRFVDDVDLCVKKIWWQVENPLDGQDLSEPYEGQEVRFYARIDNVGHGGAVTDFDVQFIVDEGGFDEVDLKTTTVKDDILFGNLGLDPLFTNSGFEGNCENSVDKLDKLCGWTIESGSVSAESYCGVDDTQCICSRIDDYPIIPVNADCNPKNLKGNLHYARLYGGGTIFRSGSFFVNGDIIEFKAQVSGSGTKKLRLCEENTTNCLEQTYNDKSFWNAYVLDVSSFIGKKVNIELSIEGSGNIEFWVDDFRMDVNTDNDVYVTTVESKNTWEATTGSHNITVKADVKNVLKESKDYDPNNPSSENNNVEEVVITKINQTDYWIKQPADFPIFQKQIQGREVQVMAEIENIGNGTTLETDLYWYTCLDTENPACADQDNWKNSWGSPAQKVTVPALANGDIYTSVFTYTAEYGNTFIIAEVNPELNVSETYVNNNIVYYAAETEVNKPRLAVQSIWWLPEKPMDGQEVTFYAAIENQWSFETGGTLDDFEVNFTVMDQLNPEKSEDLGSTKVKDDILMADRRIIDAFNVENCVFATKEKESNKLAPWQQLSGMVSVVDRCNQHGTTCQENIPNRYYTRLYGANARIRSNAFDLINDIIIFSGYTNGSGTKTIKIKQMLFDVPLPDDPEIYADQFTEKQTWRANLIKIQPGHTNEKVYIEALTQDAANAEFAIDDFRMAPPSTDNVLVAIVESNKVWTATPGSFDISVAVSVNGVGGKGLDKELLNDDDPNDNTLIKKADYVVSGPIFNTQKQVQGEDIQATAYITNIGDSTLVESEIQWDIDGKTSKETLAGLNANETYTSTITFTPKYGQNVVKFTADATDTIVETNENNNEINDDQSILIDQPELKIGSIWWSPENPKDGQEVTFFARIDNIGKGGTSDDVEVRFLVSQGPTGKQEEISKEKVTADIPFALGTSAFANADFSGKDTFMCSGLQDCNASDTLKNWDAYGEVFAESRCTIDDKKCSEKIVELIDTPNYYQCGYEYYARLYGETTLRSQLTLKKMATKYILFKAYTSGSGDKKVEILDNTLTPVIKWPITNKSWAAQIIDVTPYNLDFKNQDYYFQAVTEGAANASLMIDDIRMVSTTIDTCRVMVAKVESSKAWVALPKNSDSASDYYIHVEATDNTTTVTRNRSIGDVSRADYEVKSINVTPKEQTKGKTVTYVAVIENSGSETLVESELSWFTCYANCDDDTNWKKIWKEQQTETIPPLATNVQYTSTYVLTTEFGENWVLAFCDSGEVIVEPNDIVSLYSYNNIRMNNDINVQKPDLIVSKIGHYPKSPVDGENMIFYAQIENTFDGGTIDEIETTFLVTDENGVETTIVAEKSTNEVMFAKRQPLFTNADFELGSMINWTTQGTVFIEKDSLVNEYYKIIESRSDAREDQFFVKIYGDGSKLYSQGFTINEQSIVFKGQTTGSGVKQVSIRKCSSTECIPSSRDILMLPPQEFTESGSWRNFMLDVSDLHNEYVYLEIKTSGAANSEFWVDDFRMQKGSDFTYVYTAQAKNGWTAFPGKHNLKATVDSSQSILENHELNNSLEGDFYLSNAVDYAFTSVRYTPEEQVQGKEIIFTANLSNISQNSTLIESELEWYVCQGDINTCNNQDKWVSQSKEKVAGLASKAGYTSTFNMEVTYDDNEPGETDRYSLQVKVVCDTTNVLAEDNSKPGAENNNQEIRSIQIFHPDLVVGDIWWLPVNPEYGEEVTFYARIDNAGEGGTIQDFEVNFTVDLENSEKAIDLGATKVTTETPFALRKPLGNNPSFESGLTYWTAIIGNVSWESKCPETDLNCPGEDANNRYGDLHYARVYGNNSIFQSEKFTRTGNSLIFRGMTNGSGTKKLVIYYESDNTLKSIERSYTDKAPWRTYVIDIQEIPENSKFYLQIQTSGADGAEFMVDDFRMGKDPNNNSIIGYVESKSTWLAEPDFVNMGVHTITATLDTKNDVKESNEENNTKVESLTSIGRSDYTVTIVDYSPRKQIQGRNIELTAVIENPMSTTYKNSDVSWYLCQDSKDTCKVGDDYLAYWNNSVQTDTIDGLVEGQKHTVVFNLTVPEYLGSVPQENPDGYTIYVKVKADENDDIIEASETNNEYVQQIEIDHPDLVINDVWWIPEKPIDGQEVTFYAQIKNKGSGGTLKDYEVSFYVDKALDTEEDLGTAKMQDDILLGNRLPLVSNANGLTIGDFENNTVLSRSGAGPHTDWTRYSGEVYIASHFEESELPVKEDTVDNKKYLYVSGNGAKVQSPPFKLWGDALMFRAQTNGSGNKTLRIRPIDNNSNPDPLIENEYSDKSPWRGYLLDIEKWHNIDAYLEIETSAGLIKMDDFRMKESPDLSGAINVGTAVNTKTWLARHGAIVTVEVDSSNNIYEKTRIFKLKDFYKRLAGNRYAGSLTLRDDDENEGELNNIFEKTIILANYTDALGDIDSNGTRDLSDLILAAQIVANFNPSFANTILFEHVDVDGDDQVGLAEIIYLMVYIAENQGSQSY